MTKPLCVIAGVGPGNGLALHRRFQREGYRTALLARDLARLRSYADGNPDAVALQCDLSSPESVHVTVAQLLADLGVPDVVIYNAGSGLFGPPLETSPEDFEAAWRVNALGLLAMARAIIPAMIDNGGGSLLVTGATASLRGGANFAAFSAAKAAQRNLTQSLARSLAPQGVHVGLVIIDGVIDIPRTRAMFPDRPDSFFMRPDDIADAFVALAQQQPSAWTFEIDLRPQHEKW